MCVNKLPLDVETEQLPQHEFAKRQDGPGGGLQGSCVMSQKRLRCLPFTLGLTPRWVCPAGAFFQRAANVAQADTSPPPCTLHRQARGAEQEGERLLAVYAFARKATRLRPWLRSGKQRGEPCFGVCFIAIGSHSGVVLVPRFHLGDVGPDFSSGWGMDVTSPFCFAVFFLKKISQIFFCVDLMFVQGVVLHEWTVHFCQTNQHTSHRFLPLIHSQGVTYPCHTPVKIWWREKDAMVWVSPQSTGGSTQLVNLGPT